MVFHTTKETLQLYFALKNRGLTVLLEKQMKHNRTEITVSGINMRILVDPDHHSVNAEQTLAELTKMADGFAEPKFLRVSKVLVKFNIESVSDIIQRIATRGILVNNRA